MARGMPDALPARPDFALTAHPCAELFPLVEGEEFAALIADIATNGLQTPIVVLGNVILDGRSRYRACNEAGIPIRTKTFVGKDPLAFVLSANLHRRHLNASQRAMIAAKLETMKQGRPGKGANLHVSR